MWPIGSAVDKGGPKRRWYSAMLVTRIGWPTGPKPLAPTNAVTDVDTPVMVRTPDGRSSM